jgi:hypothetical protein
LAIYLPLGSVLVMIGLVSGNYVFKLFLFSFFGIKFEQHFLLI